MLTRAPALQLAAKLLKAGPADNQSLYIIGLGFMYQGHNVSIEIAQNGLSLNCATSFCIMYFVCL